MKIKIVRGAFLNPFEMQNYEGLGRDFDVEAISSKFPISTSTKLPLTKLWSPTDIPNIPFKYPILNRLFKDAHFLKGLEKALKGADIVHVAELYYGYTYQAIRAKRKGFVKKVISTVWETIPHNNESLKGRKRIKKYARENIDHYIAVTKRAKNCLIKEGIPEKKITVIPMGVDIDRFKPNPKLKNKRDINILCVARLVEEKGITDLLKTFLALREKTPNLRLTFVGRGPLKSDLAGHRNISVKSIPYSLIHNEYAKADIFCLPSRTNKTWEEQYGMCLVEAMASGLPIVATKTGSIPEVCGEVALLSPPHRPISLKQNLEKLIYNKELRERLGKKGRLLAEGKYNSHYTSKQIAKLYKKVLCR